MQVVSAYTAAHVHEIAARRPRSLGRVAFGAAELYKPLSGARDDLK